MYVRGKTQRTPPKLARGVCSVRTLLECTWRRTSGRSEKVNVEAEASGHLYIKITRAETGSLLYLTVEVSPDTNDWADLGIPETYTGEGIYVIPLANLGMFLRVSYIVQGALEFGVQWLGKRFELGGGRDSWGSTPTQFPS